MVISVLCAILGAASNACGTVLQRRAALRVPGSSAMRFQLLIDMLRQPAWAFGMLCVIFAAIFQAVAMATGPLALAQPIFVLELPFVFFFVGPILKRRVWRSAWWSAGFIVAGLALALAAANPHGGTAQAPMVLWILALVCCLGAIAALVAAALKRPDGPVRAACLGTAAAIGNALTAALMKSATDTFDHRGLSGFLTSWQTYGFALMGVMALFLLENAMQAGPLVASQPALTLGDALISLSLGVTLYSETVRTGWWLVPELLGVGLVVLGAVGLSRQPALSSKGDARAQAKGGATAVADASS
ncbi:hypothetical protein BIV57_19475 [Mangrovactinospora gilvigrisea]|uniref:Uncharacterized protein n=1 Tax=Mangrovactinospora gilvigrisea TaxID=1428644 RepID=A0A1J7C866_9ACTN|nr:hypothetical protein BIV57_19475 [Mangrovactinospora gilvigrisea]